MKQLIRYTFIALLISMVACKTSQPTSKTPSSELVDTDFTPYLPKVSTIEGKEEVVIKTPQEEKELTFPEGIVNTDIDSLLTHLSARDLGGIPVYRVLVYSGRERGRAEDIVYNLKHTFGNYEVEMTFEQPNYKVRAGYYFDRLTAHGIHTSIKKKYKSAFLIKEKMNADEIAKRIKKANAAKADAMDIDDEY